MNCVAVVVVVAVVVLAVIVVAVVMVAVVVVAVVFVAVVVVAVVVVAEEDATDATVAVLKHSQAVTDSYEAPQSLVDRGILTCTASSTGVCDLDVCSPNSYA